MFNLGFVTSQSLQICHHFFFFFGFRSHLIWIYTVCKDRVYPGSAGPEWKKEGFLMYLEVWCKLGSMSGDQICRVTFWSMVNCSVRDITLRWVLFAYPTLFCLLLEYFTFSFLFAYSASWWNFLIFPDSHATLLNGQFAWNVSSCFVERNI